MKRRDYNYFKCSECNKVTKHIRLSLREFDSDRKYISTGEKVFDVFADALGVTELVGTLGGPKYYKCCECGNRYIDN